MSERANPSTFDVLRYRIMSDIKHFHGDLPERYAIAWHGFLAGIFEYDIIKTQEYMALTDLLPPIPEPNPVRDIFAGRPDD